MAESDEEFFSPGAGESDGVLKGLKGDFILNALFRLPLSFARGSWNEGLDLADFIN